MDNIVLQLQKSNNNSVSNDENVIFDEMIFTTGNISYDSITGIITIPENGLYLIDWRISTQTTTASSGVAFQVISDKGHEFDSSSVNKAGSLSGTAVLNVDDAPIQFSLVNKSSAAVSFAETIISKANLRVFNLKEDDNSRCFALDQFANVLEQIVTIYQGASVTIFSTRTVGVSGTIDSLYKAPDAGSIPLLILQSGGQSVAFSIDKITMLYFPDSVYDDSIAYLDPPDPFPQNCDTDFLKNIYNYVEVGNTISITTGPVTNASGGVSVNEYGIIVLADAASTIFLMTPHIFSIVVSAEAEGAERSVTISPPV